MGFWSSVGSALGSIGNGLLGGLPGAALSIGTSMIGNSIANNQAKSNMREQNAWSEKMNLQQQQWQEEMWNKNNEYNSPANQMQRLIEAGVNPNSAAGLVSGSPSQSQMAQQPTIPNSNPMWTPGVSVDPLVASQIDLNNANKRNVESDTENKNLQNSVFLADKNVQWALAASQKALNDSNVKLTDTQREVADYQLKEYYPKLVGKTDEEIENLKKANQAYEEQIELYKKEQRLTEEKVKTEQAQQGALSAQAEAARSQASLNRAHEKTLEGDVESAKIRSSICKEYGVDPNDLDDIEKVNLQLNKAGYSDEQRSEFWNSLWLGVGDSFERGFKKDAN